MRHEFKKRRQPFRWHIDYGWDEQYGGILLSRDAGWRCSVVALCRLQSCGGPIRKRFTLCCWHMNNQMRPGRWSGSRRSIITPSATTRFRCYGEWTQKLDRQGQKFSETVALPVKDPFHLPRALIYCIAVLERLAGEAPAQIKAG